MAGIITRSVNYSASSGKEHASFQTRAKSGTNQGFFKALGRNAVIDHMEMGVCFLESLGMEKAVKSY